MTHLVLCPESETHTGRPVARQRIGFRAPRSPSCLVRLPASIIGPTCRAKASVVDIPPTSSGGKASRKPAERPLCPGGEYAIVYLIGRSSRAPLALARLRRQRQNAANARRTLRTLKVVEGRRCGAAETWSSTTRGVRNSWPPKAMTQSPIGEGTARSDSLKGGISAHGGVVARPAGGNLAVSESV